jgi:two-component system, NarL family, invasion response regulator UvrY
VHPCGATTRHDRVWDMIGVLIVDDQESFRRAAQAIVSATDGFEAVAESASAEEALEAAVQLRPQLALVDVRMPGLDGFETSRRIRAVLPETVVVLVSADPEPEPDQVEASGAAAFIPKEALNRSMLQDLWQQHGAG